MLFQVRKANKCFLNKYSKLSLDKLALVDVLAISGIHMEDYFANRYMSNYEVIQNWALEPLLGKYSKCFENKKILVISPFAKDIDNQYQRRELLFKDQSILPNFILKTIEAPLTLGEEEITDQKDWFTCLEEMKKQAEQLR